MMEPVAQAFSDNWRVYAPDLPGHGLSPAPPGPWGIPEYARLVCRLIDAFGSGPVPVIAHSNGGRIALYIASENDLRGRLSRLVLVSPSGIRPLRSARYYVKRTIAEATKAPFRVLPEPFRGRSLNWLRRTLLWKALGSSDYRAAEGVMRDVFVRTVAFHLDDRVHRIQMPTLIFRGDQDEAISAVQMDRLVRAIPGAAFVPLRGGHYAYIDDLAAFLAAARPFLEPDRTRTSPEGADPSTASIRPA